MPFSLTNYTDLSQIRLIANLRCIQPGRARHRPSFACRHPSSDPCGLFESAFFQPSMNVYGSYFSSQHVAQCGQSPTSSMPWSAQLITHSIASTSINQLPLHHFKVAYIQLCFCPLQFWSIIAGFQMPNYPFVLTSHHFPPQEGSALEECLFEERALAASSLQLPTNLWSRALQIDRVTMPFLPNKYNPILIRTFQLPIPVTYLPTWGLRPLSKRLTKTPKLPY